MEQYEELDWQDLLDLLVTHTRAYNTMLANRVFNEDEFVHCKRTLAEIHAAIKLQAEAQGHPMKNVFPNFPDYSGYTKK